MASPRVGEAIPDSHLPGMISRGISTLHAQVAGLHRACPSASLDKNIFDYIDYSMKRVSFQEETVLYNKIFTYFALFFLVNTYSANVVPFLFSVMDAS